MDQVNVLVVLGESTEGNRTSEIVDHDGNKTYHGFNWDLWTRVRKKLEDKYTFVISFTDKTDENYNGFIKNVSEGKFDMVVGTFFRTPWRESYVDFVTPHTIDSNVILHKNDDNIFSDLYKVLNKTWLLILYLVLIGLVFGLLLFNIDPQRRNILRKQNQSYIKFLFRSLLTGIATVFGEMGFLSENASLSVGGMLLVIFIMIVSVILLMFAQAKITKNMIHINSKFTTSNIYSKEFLSFKGYSVAEKLKKYKVKLTLRENITTQQLVDEYLDNDNKYSGCILSYSHAAPYAKLYNNLTISDGFGNEPAGWVISNRYNELRKDINTVILDMAKGAELRRTCESYFYKLGNLCSL